MNFQEYSQQEIAINTQRNNPEPSALLEGLDKLLEYKYSTQGSYNYVYISQPLTSTRLFCEMEDVSHEFRVYSDMSVFLYFWRIRRTRPRSVVRFNEEPKQPEKPKESKKVSALANFDLRKILKKLKPSCKSKKTESKDLSNKREITDNEDNGEYYDSTTYYGFHYDDCLCGTCQTYNRWYIANLQYSLELINSCQCEACLEYYYSYCYY